MQTVTLYIETPGGQQTVTLENEISIGRTDAAQLVLNDPSLSRLHATIFREGEDVWILDENSSNGSFVNGERVSPERKQRDGDEIVLGSQTRIYVEMAQPAGYTRPQASTTKAPTTAKPPATAAGTFQMPAPPPPAAPKKPSLPLIPIIAGTFAFFIIVFAAIALLVVSSGGDNTTGNSTPRPTTQASFTSVIPVRVMDPLGGEDPDDLDDFLSSWEGEEEELKAENIEEIKTVSSTGESAPRTDLIVSTAFWQQQKAKALSRGRGGEPLIVTPQMSGRGFGLQLQKVRQLRDKGYKVPLDFADLAELRLNGVLVELPIATQTYVLEVGGSATGEPFTEFDFVRGTPPILPGSEKYNYLKRLADNFDGQKYNLDDPQHRKQMRMRLLRMYNANSRKLLEEICAAYYERFKVPLRITSLTRSMDYQISLNKTNGNSYRVRSPDALPPHTSGCAFDVGRNHLPNDAQNFLIEILSRNERDGKLDTLIEGNVNACFHTFIYPDGTPPNQAPVVASQPKPAVNPPAKPAPKTAK